MRPVRRILFVRTDRIGDALMNLPAIRSLRLAYPKAWITLLAGPAASELLRGHPDLDEVMTLAEADAGTFAGRVRLWRRLRAARFDLAVVSNPSKLFHFLVWAAGIPVRAGHDRKGPLFLNRRLPAREALLGLHEIERNLKLAECAAGKPWDGEIVLPADEAAARRIDERLASVLERFPSVIAVHPGTSHPKKRWPSERFGALCQRIHRELGRGVVLIGGAEEADAAAAIRAAAPETVDWTGQTSLRELTAFFAHRRVSALVSSDSGPVHVAWISKTPVVALYAMDLAGSDPLRWGPRDGVSESIHKAMEAITVDEVMASLRRLLVRPARKEARA
jgi:ADP-heptose:LPS heptosyltransferase